MKVLLVTTPQSPMSINSGAMVLLEPLALEYLAAGIKENHDIKFVDLRSELEPGLKETLESFQPDILGLGAFTTEVNSAKRLCAEAKKIVPDILTVIGGPHATVLPHDFYEDYIDVVVAGEGIFPFKKICDYHEQQKSFEDIENIHYRKNGKMVFTNKQEHPPLDSLPIPDRSITSHLRHLYQTFILNKPMPLATARGSLGCSFRCKFCAVSRVLNGKIYHHSIDRIVSELESIEAPAIYWIDDEFILDHKRAIAMARAIDKAGIKKHHLFMARADTIINHSECIEEWAKIGLEYVLIGLESFRQEDLKKMRKKSSLTKNEEAVNILHSNGIKVRGSFILQQDFDKSDFKRSLKYARKLAIDVPAFCVWTPLPGTELYEEEKNNMISDNYDLFDVVHTLLPTKLPLKEFYKNYHKISKKIIPVSKKIKILRELDPQFRKKIIKHASIFLRRIKYAYQDYE